METTNPHAHQWRCLKTDDKILECAVPGCEVVARITDLLDKTEQRGIELGRFQISRDLLGRSAMLTVRGRRALNRYISSHPLQRRMEHTTANQMRLVR